MRRLQLLLAVAVASLCLTPANAAIRLTLSSGGNTITVNGTNFANYIGAVGNWNLNVTTGIVGNNPLLDLNSVDQVTGNGTGANALTITLSATDYVGPAGAFDSHIGGTLAAGHSLTYQAYYNPNNTLGATQNAIGSLLSFGPGAIPFSGQRIGGGVGAGLYGLTQVVVISATSSGNSSFNAAIGATPEPASIVLLSGIALFAVSRLRKSA